MRRCLFVRVRRHQDASTGRKQIRSFLTGNGCQDEERIFRVQLAVSEVFNNYLAHAGEKRLLLLLAVVSWHGEQFLLLTFFSLRSFIPKLLRGLRSWIAKGNEGPGLLGSENGRGGFLFFELLKPIRTAAYPGVMLCIAPVQLGRTAVSRPVSVAPSSQKRAMP